jgi:hypothetical protein
MFHGMYKASGDLCKCYWVFSEQMTVKVFLLILLVYCTEGSITAKHDELKHIACCCFSQIAV